MPFKIQVDIECSDRNTMVQRLSELEGMSEFIRRTPDWLKIREDGTLEFMGGGLKISASNEEPTC